MADKGMDWKWHLWHIPAKGNRKYMGFMYDEKAALKWKRQQDNPDEYKITNYGPTDLAKMAGPRPTTPTKKVTTRQRSNAEESMAAARKEADRRMRESEKQRAERRKRKEEDDREYADIRSDAADLVAGLKKDEEDDLKKGINR